MLVNGIPVTNLFQGDRNMIWGGMPVNAVAEATLVAGTAFFRAEDQQVFTRKLKGCIMTQISYDEFLKVDMRVGEIVEVEEFERARNPSYKIKVNFGPDIGEKWSSAQAKLAYSRKELLGMQVIAVVNFPPKNIAGFMSEVLVLGVEKEDGSLSLLQPSRQPAALGSRVY